MNSKMTERPKLADWGMVRKVGDAVGSGAYGQLCSLRWSWLDSDTSPDLLYTGVLAELLAVSERLVGGKLVKLHIEPVKDAPACFGLAEFEDGVVAELEIYNALKFSVPAARFLTADFTAGRVTNRPLVGHHHVEGAFLATAERVGAVGAEPLPEVGEVFNHPEIQRAIADALERATR